MRENQENGYQPQQPADGSSHDARSLSAKDVAKYTLLPGILPRLYRLSRHFSEFMFMFTRIFGSVGLIPRDHPCLMSENMGRYRFTDILGMAASNVIFDRKHLPQTIMFFAVILSITLMVAIVLGLAASTILNVSSAHAQLFGTPTGMSGVTYSESTDWAMNFLYRIFGNTGVIPAPALGTGLGNPWFTMMLVTMLKYYSLAMLSVGAFMILYILIITVTESARTGEPFSSRFDGVWAPIRLALAIGLLMPVMSSGYNGAQIIALQTAVWGSNLATNVWYGGLSSTADNQKFFTAMMSDPGYRFVRDVFLVNLCVEGLKKQSKAKTWKEGNVRYIRTWHDGYETYSFGTKYAPEFCGKVKIMERPSAGKPDGITGKSWPEKVVAGYQGIAKEFLPLTYESSIPGRAGPQILKGSTQMGEVASYAAEKLVGSEKQKADSAYFSEVVSEHFPTSEKVVGWMKKYWEYMGVTSYACPPNSPAGCQKERGNYFMSADYGNSIAQYNQWIVNRMTKDAEHGWTTAGVFYLRISSAFSSISEVVNNPPVVSALPTNFAKIYATTVNPSATSESVGAECSSTWNWIVTFFRATSTCMTKYKNAKELYTFLNGGKDWFHNSIADDPDAYHLMDGQNFSRALDISEPESSTGQESSNVTGPVFEGFFANMLRVDSKELNPLGVIIQWGNAMMTASFVAFGLAFAAQGSAYADLALSLASLMIISGFILTFWVPTLPFMHFTFAVIEWMISVLEAVIGMPLWALSMITLQGDGLGKNGMDGVKRLFEIMLRPTIIIISLVASIIIFTAGVAFFNSAIAVYDDAQSAANGFFAGLVAGPAMLFVYCFGVYTLATSCFKLVDHIPDKFGRWMGLEGGFGGDIKVGMSELTNLIVGGAIFKTINDGAKGVVDGQKKNRKGKAGAAAQGTANNGGPPPTPGGGP